MYILMLSRLLCTSFHCFPLLCALFSVSISPPPCLPPYLPRSPLSLSHVHSLSTYFQHSLVTAHNIAVSVCHPSSVSLFLQPLSLFVTRSPKSFSPSLLTSSSSLCFPTVVFERKAWVSIFHYCDVSFSNSI